MKDKYDKDLENPLWKARAKEIKQGWNNRCFICDFPSSHLQCHHIQYRSNKWGKPWDYKDVDLIPVCSSCHKKIHENGLLQKTIDKKLSYLASFQKGLVEKIILIEIEKPNLSNKHIKILDDKKTESKKHYYMLLQWWMRYSNYELEEQGLDLTHELNKKGAQIDGSREGFFSLDWRREIDTINYNGRFKIEIPRSHDFLDSIAKQIKSAVEAEKWLKRIGYKSGHTANYFHILFIEDCIFLKDGLYKGIPPFDSPKWQDL